VILVLLWAYLPVSAGTQIGNQTYCHLAVYGKAVRTPVQTGVSDGSWAEEMIPPSRG